MEKVPVTTQNTMGMIKKIHIFVVNLRVNGSSTSTGQKIGLIERVGNEKPAL